MTEEELEEEKEKYGTVKLTDKNTIEINVEKQHLIINVSEIKAIGEYTTYGGPVLNDWFLAFITQTKSFEIPMYTNGISDFLKDLGKVLNSDLSTKLANSTEWKTRIIYPTEFQESELYTIEYIEPKNIYQKFKQLIGLQNSIKVYSSVLKEIISN